MIGLKVKKNLSEEVAEYIKTSILDGLVNPGDSINETKLSRELGISSTPVREAIRLLSGEGIVEIVRNKGAVVLPLDSTDIYEIYSIRAVLEGVAMRIAIKNATDEEVQQIVDFYENMKKQLLKNEISSLSPESIKLHKLIIELSNHKKLIQLLNMNSFKMTLANRMLGNKYSKQEEIEEHEELVLAFIRRDHKNAEKIMRNHILKAYNRLIEFQNMQENQLIYFPD